LHIEPHDLAPISERVKESMIEQGLPYHPDMFSTGETPHGCGHVPRTVHQGIRTTAADFITRGYKRQNITIKTEVTVDKILFSQDLSDLSASGVAAISKTGKRVEYQARKEVIVTAGAYCSPPILMRSGLGPKEQLEKHGIKCLVDLPGVGGNLMDHVVSDLSTLLLPALWSTIPDCHYSSASSSMKYLNQTLRTTILHIMTTQLRRPTSFIERRRAGFCLPSLLVYSATHVWTNASKILNFGRMRSANPEGTLWVWPQTNPTSSSGTRNCTAGRSNIQISPWTTSMHSRCVHCCSTSTQGVR
jgi:choline dehydrogenase-like flavoprotein